MAWAEQRYKLCDGKYKLAGWAAMDGGEYCHQLGSFVFWWRWLAVLWGWFA